MCAYFNWTSGLDLPLTGPLWCPWRPHAAPLNRPPSVSGFESRRSWLSCTPAKDFAKSETMSVENDCNLAARVRRSVVTLVWAMDRSLHSVMTRKSALEKRKPRPFRKGARFTVGSKAVIRIIRQAIDFGVWRPGWLTFDPGECDGSREHLIFKQTSLCRNLGHNLFWGQLFWLSEQQYFVWDTTSESAKCAAGCEVSPEWGSAVKARKQILKNYVQISKTLRCAVYKSSLVLVVW